MIGVGYHPLTATNIKLRSINSMADTTSISNTWITVCVTLNAISSIHKEPYKNYHHAAIYGICGKRMFKSTHDARESFFYDLGHTFSSSTFREDKDGALYTGIRRGHQATNGGDRLHCL